MTLTSIFYGAGMSAFWQGAFAEGWPIWLLVAMTIAVLIATFALINAWYAHSQWCALIEQERDDLLEGDDAG